MLKQVLANWGFLFSVQEILKKSHAKPVKMVTVSY